jgi:4-hydroxybenzoate polyprenyltransferase
MARRSAASAGTAASAQGTRARPLAAEIVLALRPHQWTKNLFVFAGLIFGQKLLDADAVLAAVLAFATFCALSGAVYLINDVRDRDADRRHPLKSHRPIAAGRISVGLALTVAALLTMAALATAFVLLPVAFGYIAAAYVVLLSLYSLSLKHIVILDVLTIAIGFVLRAWAGAEAVVVPFSHWLLLLMLLGALFLALTKRRAELVALAGQASGHRPSLAEYSPHLLDQMIGIVAASTVLGYAFYTIDQETVAKFGTERLLWTVPFPLYGLFRYLYLVHQRAGGDNPSEVLLTDLPIIACVILWVAAVVLILYAPGPAVIR